MGSVRWTSLGSVLRDLGGFWGILGVSLLLLRASRAFLRNSSDP